MPGDKSDVHKAMDSFDKTVSNMKEIRNNKTAMLAMTNANIANIDEMIRAAEYLSKHKDHTEKVFKTLPIIERHYKSIL